MGETEASGFRRRPSGLWRWSARPRSSLIYDAL